MTDLRASRILCLEDGSSAFEDMVFDFAMAHEHGRETAVLPAQAIAFVWTAPGLDLDWHNASRERLILVLDGELEVEVTNGERRTFGPGHILNPTDRHGTGHKSWGSADKPLKSVLIEIGDPPDTPWQVADNPEPPSYPCTRNVTGDDGASHFVDDELPFTIRAPLGLCTALQPLRGYQIVEKPAALDHDFHNAPQKQFVINLVGAMEVENGDGATRRFAPGDIFLGEDTTGQGHKTRAVDGRTRYSLFAHLA